MTRPTDSNAQNQQHERPSAHQVRGHHKVMANNNQSYSGSLEIIGCKASKLVVMGAIGKAKKQMLVCELMLEHITKH